MINVSIVIVCMNNLKNLYPCLDSIKRYTNVSYETFVVAYLFTKENLEKLRKDYPWIIIIVSDEIRGFSENNNLALRQAKGKYCFVLNDDTEMKMPVIDQLVQTIEALPEEVAIVSPKIIDGYGKVQVCGRPYINWWYYILSLMRFYKERVSRSEGVFKSYNILGACFLIKTHVFKEHNWFDERYFFCPEDIALSTDLNKKGYECWVNADIEIIHYEGMSGGKSLSMIKTATRPAGLRGSLLFYSNDNPVILFITKIFAMPTFILKFIYHRLKSLMKSKPNSDYILSIGDKHCIAVCFSQKSPKEIFIKYYERIKNGLN